MSESHRGAGIVLFYDYDKMGRLVTRTLPLVTSGADLARTISYTVSVN